MTAVGMGRDPDVGRWQDALIATEDARSIAQAAELLWLRGQARRAIPLFKAAADLGDARSMGRLVALLSKSEGDEPLQWQERLIARKDGKALRELAETFESDDRERAMTLYQAAAAAGDYPATDGLSDWPRSDEPSDRPAT
jgi:hypothetical protein